MLTKHLFKVLGISMLAAIGVMAVNASAVQASWTILQNGNAVPSISLVGTAEPGEMLVPGLLGISCTGGSANATAKTEEEGKVLSGSGSATFTGCVVKDSTGKVNKNCTVNSPEKSSGTIFAEGEGKGSMPNVSDVLFLLKSNKFSDILISGPLCPLDEFDATVNGAVTLLIAHGSLLKTLHKVHIDEHATEGLFYGENEAELHSPENSGILGSMELDNEGSYRFALLGL